MVKKKFHLSISSSTMQSFITCTCLISYQYMESQFKDNIMEMVIITDKTCLYIPKTWLQCLDCTSCGIWLFVIGKCQAICRLSCFLERSGLWEPHSIFNLSRKFSKKEVDSADDLDMIVFSRKEACTFFDGRNHLLWFPKFLTYWIMEDSL